MEHYSNDGAATLSLYHGSDTDNLIASAIKTLPKSAVAEIMPVVKTKGPTSQWVEPWYVDDKIKLVSTPISMFAESNKRKHISFSAEALDKICRTYTPEGFTHVVHNWVLFQKNKQQRNELVQLLKSPEINGVPADGNIPNLKDPLSEDNSKLIQTRILAVMNDIKKDFQLGNAHFSVVAPYELGFAMTQLQITLKDKIHVMFDDTVDKVYVFPTGERDLSRAGFAIFEYADEHQKAIDPETGESVFWVYNRSQIAVNPLHQEHPIIRNLTIG